MDKYIYERRNVPLHFAQKGTCCCLFLEAMEYSGVFKEHHPGICIIQGLFVAKKSCCVIGFILRFIELVYNTVFLIVRVIYLKHMG